MICQAEPPVAEDDCRQLTVFGVLEGDVELAVALATGASLKDAAQRAGISIRTAQRRWSDPDFQREVHAVRRLYIEQAVGTLVSASVMAAQTLMELARNGSDMVRLAAARSILDLGSRLRAEMELEQRLCEVEDRVRAHDAKSRPQNRDA